MRKAYVYLSFVMLLLVAGGCESDSRLDGQSNIYVVGLGKAYSGIGTGEDALFSGNDILWFNERTEEIRFREGFWDKGLSMYETILFKLADMELFTAKVVSGTVDAVFEDLVLFHDLVTDKYYLRNGYPDGTDTEVTRLNVEIRAENWALFLIQMRREGRIKE